MANAAGHGACLHPYRKRKFFYALADLFHEPPPVIQRLEDFFPPTESDADQPPPDDQEDTCSVGRQDHAQLLAADDRVRPTSEATVEEDEDSFEYVDFDRSRASLDSVASLRMGLASQSSLHDSMQDSLLFLPPELCPQASGTLSATQQSHVASQDGGSSQPTILSSAPTRPYAELVDYYDLDRYCEAVPCWAYDNQSTCTLHTEPIRRPMLLFCLQALDEFLACAQATRRTTGALVVACRLARIVFAAMWEQDVLKVSTEGDIALTDYVANKKSMAGVSLDVWKVIDSCWLRFKQNFLHHQELYFVESPGMHASGRVEQWRRVRHLLQVYGVRPDVARRLEAELPAGEIALLDLQPDNFTRGSSTLQSIQLGVNYLQEINEKCAAHESASLRRDVLSQSDWKLAFRAIELHLKQWSRDVHIFPCGAFSRGAAYGSVVDLLVGLPEGSGDETSVSPIQLVLKVLAKAKIIDLTQVAQLSKHRALAIIPFKKLSVILDVKVYERPCSWFGLLYFTGPESFTQTYFATLLRRSLAELDVVDFGHIYECVVDQLGPDVVAAVDSEKHLFNLINTEYILPPQRM